MLKLDHGDENDNSDENKDDKANNLNIEVSKGLFYLTIKFSLRNY